MKAILSVLLFIPVMLFSQVPITVASQEGAQNKDEIFEEVDVEANFPGGAAEMMQYIAHNVKYPEISMENGEQGKVFVEFVVNKDGSVSNIKILRGVSKDIDVEAMRVVKNMPKWTPAEIEGKKVRSIARIPINFILTD
jgi:protein TonB